MSDNQTIDLETLAMAVEGISNTIAIWDRDDRLIFCNERFLNLNADIPGACRDGITFEEHIRLCLENGQYPDAAGCEEDWLARRMAAHQNPGDPWLLERKGDIWINIHDYILPDGRTVTLARDISSRKRAERELQNFADTQDAQVRARTAELEENNRLLKQEIEEREKTELALRESEARFRNFAEISSDWLWETDAENRFVWMSDNVEQIVGVPPEWHYGKTRQDIIGPNYDPEIWEDHFRTLNERKPFRNFVFYRIGEGVEPYWLSSSGSPCFDEAGNFTGYRGVGTDLSEIATVREMLERREADLQTLMDAFPVAIMYVDKELRFQHLNRTSIEWFAFDRDTVINRSIPEVLPGLYEKRRDILDRALAGETIRTDGQYHYPDGITRDISLSLFPRTAENGDVSGVGILVEDISEKLAMQRQLMQSQKMEAVGQLTGGVAHDFNNLLTSVLGNLELASEAIANDEQTEQKIGKLIQSAFFSARRGADLVRHLLAFSRQQILVPETINVNTIVADMVENILERTLGENIIIEFDRGPDLPDVLVDRGQLENAVLNLSVNARDAMPDGGKLLLSTSLVEIGEADSRDGEGPSPGTWLSLAVRDTGSGMDDTTRARAFDPFFTTKEVGKGSGLGLSMVFGFMSQSGGHVRIDSEPGQGTCVELYLPVNAESRTLSENETPVPKAPVGGSGERILLIEDDEDVREFTEMMLEHLGYQVVIADDGPSALNIAQEIEPVDLVISDFILPNGLRGNEVAEKLREVWPGIRVLFVSGYTETSVPGRGSPRSAFLGKPFSRQDLADTIIGLLDGPAA